MPQSTFKLDVFGLRHSGKERLLVYGYLVRKSATDF
jgi:hypothetical protein